MYIFHMILNTQHCSTHPSCYAGLYFVVLQIPGIVLRIKMCHLSVGRCIRVVRQLENRSLSHMTWCLRNWREEGNSHHSVCAKKKTPNEIKILFLGGWSIIHRFLLFAGGVLEPIPYEKRGMIVFPSTPLSSSYSWCQCSVSYDVKSKRSKGVPRQAEVALGVPGRLRPQISWFSALQGW